MHAAEIIVLIAGAILFTVSFFMSDRSKGTAVLDEEEERKLIKELLDKEVEGARFRIDEAAQEAVSENKDRMERAMDRITNEKMSAVDEYSNTVQRRLPQNLLQNRRLQRIHQMRLFQRTSMKKASDM